MSRYVKVSSISMCECDIRLKDKDKSSVDFVLEYISRNISQVLPDEPDLIVLPELCDRPYGFKSIAERMAYFNERGDVILDFLRKIASDNKCYITYPTYLKRGGRLTNSCVMIGRKGETVGIYDKNYPTVREIKNYGIACGTEATIFDCDFGRVGAAICFDLNFDEYRLRLKAQKPDMIVFMSNFHGGIIRNFYAYDTRSYLISSLGFSNLHGSIISPVGEQIAESTTYCNYITKTLNMDYVVCHLDFNIDLLPQIKEKYGSKVSLYDPGNLGSVLISSETEEFTAEDIVREFGLELLDDYLERSSAERNQNINQ